MQCNLVRNEIGDRKSVLILVLDRTSIQPSTSELHVHLAHALVRYLSLPSGDEMATYGLSSITDLVDLISRVRRYVYLDLMKSSE